MMHGSTESVLPQPQQLRAGAALMVIPAIALVTLVVVGGLGMLVAESVGLLPFVGQPHFSLDAYLSGGNELPESLAISLGVAGAATVVAVAVGFIAAVVILQARWSGRLVEWVSAASIPVPHLVGAAATGLLLSSGGFLARLFHVPGSEWPSLIAGPWWVGTTFEYGWKESAFVALIIVGTLAGHVRRYDEAAALLGAGRRARLRHVILPLAAPAMMISGVIVFVYTLGTYEVAWLLGPAYPETLPVMALRLYNSVTLNARPEAAAIAVITVVVSALAVFAALSQVNRIRLWR